MFHPAVIADREAKLHDTLGARIPGGRLVRSSRERCWGLRDQLADAWHPKRGEQRPLTAEEQTFIAHEQLLATIDRTYWMERYAFVAKETQDLEPLTPLWKSQDLFLAHVAAQEAARYFDGHPDGLLFNALKARQLGISTITEVLLAAAVTTSRTVQGLVAADVEEQSKYMFSMAERVIEHLPWWLKPPTAAPTTTGKQITFETGAALRAAWGKSSRGKLQERDGQKGNLGRGKTFGLVHLSELSTWERPEQIYDGLLPGIPRRPRTFVVFESTAKGRYDDWHKQWDQTERGIGRFANIFIPWYIEPEKYWLPVPDGWVPAASTVQHAEEVERDSPRWTLGPTIRLAREQLYWYEQTRRTFDDEHLGSEFTADGRRVQTFYEEYPASPRDAFQHAGQSIFGVKVLERLKGYERPPVAILDIAPAKDLAMLAAFEREMAKSAETPA